MFLDEAQKRAEGYPPEYEEYVRQTLAGRAKLKRSVLISGALTLFFGWGYVHDWLPYVFWVAPIAALVFLLLLLSLAGSVESDLVVAILPYFNKSHPGVSGGCSFLGGKALARNYVSLEALALAADLEPLSQFRSADDLHSGRVTWHEPERGLKAVSGLRAALTEDPSLLREAEAVLADLVLIEANLQEAVRLQAPFCLLLRYGWWASGHEMEVRKGYFCYSDAASTNKRLHP